MKKTGFSLRTNVVAVVALISGSLFGISSQAAPTASTDLNSSVTAAALAPYVRNVSVHDPSTLIKCKDEFWVFTTGRGVPSLHSKDLVNWERGPAVFTSNAPPWVAEAVPANRGMNYWAPDVTLSQWPLSGSITRLRVSARASPALGWPPPLPSTRTIPLTAGLIREWLLPQRQRMISMRLTRRYSMTQMAVSG